MLPLSWCPWRCCLACAPQPPTLAVCGRLLQGAMLGVVQGLLPPTIPRVLAPSTHCVGLSCVAARVPHTPPARAWPPGSPPVLPCRQCVLGVGPGAQGGPGGPPLASTDLPLIAALAPPSGFDARGHPGARPLCPPPTHRLSQPLLSFPTPLSHSYPTPSVGITPANDAYLLSEGPPPQCTPLVGLPRYPARPPPHPAPPVRPQCVHC